MESEFFGHERALHRRHERQGRPVPAARRRHAVPRRGRRPAAACRSSCCARSRSEVRRSAATARCRSTCASSAPRTRTRRRSWRRPAFREDLYYRINVIRARAARRCARATSRCSCQGHPRSASQAQRASRAHAQRRRRARWSYAGPGNVRELENVLDARSRLQAVAVYMADSCSSHHPRPRGPRTMPWNRASAAGAPGRDRTQGDLRCARANPALQPHGCCQSPGHFVSRAPLRMERLRIKGKHDARGTSCAGPRRVAQWPRLGRSVPPFAQLRRSAKFRSRSSSSSYMRSVCPRANSERDRKISF